MKASPLTIVELLKSKLLTYPVLVDSLQNKNLNFLLSLENWMREMETIFKNNNITECAAIAGLRSKILAPLFADGQRRSAKKKQWQVAAEVLYDLQNTVLSVMKPYEIKVEAARDLLLQLSGILKQSGAVKYIDGTDFQNFINQVWKMLLSHEQLRPTAIKILTLVSQTDAVRIIAEEINPNEWK